MIALRAIAFQATPCGWRACVLAIATTASTCSGNRIAHSNACIPPSEPPATAASRSIPSSVRNARSVRTMSATVITGKSGPYGLPVAGSVDAGRAVAVLGAEPVARTLAGRRLREAGRVGVAAERMAHQDDVVAPGREGAVGLVCYANRVQFPSAVEPHRLWQVEVLRLDRADRADRADRELRG